MKIKKNKCIGIIGGVGPQATQDLYEKIIRYSQEIYKVSQNHEYPRVLIISEPVIDFIESKESIDTAKEQILKSTERLIDAGVTCIAIASNTVHILAEDVKKICDSSNVEFVSMIEVVVEHCFSSGYKRVGLLASPVTLNSHLYNKPLSVIGLELIKPSKKVYSQLGCIIKKVIANSISRNDSENFVQICTGLAEKVDAIILGCTELPILYNKIETVLPNVDTSSILAKSLLKKYYKTSELNERIKL